MKKKYILEFYYEIIRDFQRPQLFPELSVGNQIQPLSPENTEILSKQNEKIIKHYRERIYSSCAKSPDFVLKTS